MKEENISHTKLKKCISELQRNNKNVENDRIQIEKKYTLLVY